MAWYGRARLELILYYSSSCPPSRRFTAAIGLLTAYLLSRQNFVGKASFEFIAVELCHSWNRDRYWLHHGL